MTQDAFPTVMQHAHRIAIVGILALLQLFSPLVHAHFGGEPLFGRIHVPGLEFLAKPVGIAAQNLARKDGSEFFVGPPAGLAAQAHNSSSSDRDQASALPPLPPSPATSRTNVADSSTIPAPGNSRYFRLGPASRAPPKSF